MALKKASTIKYKNHLFEKKDIEAACMNYHNILFDEYETYHTNYAI